VRTRNVSIIVGVASILLVAIIANLSHTKATAQAQKPFAVTIYYEEEQESYGPTGTTAEHRTGQYGRASDGSFYERGEDALSISYDAQTRKMQSFDVATGRVSTIILDAKDAAKFSAVPVFERCPSPGPFQYITREAVLGIPADKFTGAFGPTEVTVWLAPQYGCVFLREESVTRQGGQTISRRNRRAVTIVPGEPNRGLFRAPENLKEVPPSELEFARFQARYGAQTPIPECLRRTGTAKDTRYYGGGPQPR